MPSSADDWTPGPILPPRKSRSVPVSVRMPADLYEELGRYATRVGARRSYLILECLRRLVAAKKMKGPVKASALKASAKRRGLRRPRRRR
jgi:hypothetical protein